MPHAGGAPGDQTRVTLSGAVALQLAGAGLTLIGAFVPWVRSHALFLTVPVRGAETDYGLLFPGVALVVAALLAYQWTFRWHRWMDAAVLGLGIVALAVALLYGVQVTQRVSRIDAAAHRQPATPQVLGGGSMFSVEFDVGYYLTLLGAGALIAGSFAGLRRKSGRTATL